MIAVAEYQVVSIECVAAAERVTMVALQESIYEVGWRTRFVASGRGQSPKEEPQSINGRDTCVARYLTLSKRSSSFDAG